MTFKQAIEEFEQYLITINRSPATIRGYRKNLNKFNSYLCEKNNCQVFINEIIADDLEQYILKEISEKAYSCFSRHAVITAFKSLFNYCYSMGFCKINVGRQVKNVKQKAIEREFVTYEEFERIEKAIDNETLKLVVQTLFYTGIRISEVLRVQIKDVDTNKALLNVRDYNNEINRSIPINIKLLPILKDYLRNKRRNIDTDILFASRSGNLSESHIGKSLKYAVMEAGINKNVTANTLRNSFAINLIDGGVDIAKVQKLLGHRALNSTLIYLNTNVKELEKVVNLL